MFRCVRTGNAPLAHEQLTHFLDSHSADPSVKLELARAMLEAVEHVLTASAGVAAATASPCTPCTPSPPRSPTFTPVLPFEDDSSDLERQREASGRASAREGPKEALPPLLPPPSASTPSLPPHHNLKDMLRFTYEGAGGTHGFSHREPRVSVSSI
eukprot:RCo041667